MSRTSRDLQLFFWCGPHTKLENRTHYQQFSLNNQTFNIGDCVYLFPEDDSQPHYLGRIRSAFIDEAAVGQDPPPHNIEIKWFERRVNLEQSTKGITESEKEVFELEDTDINPIGCISGKCHIFRARSYQEAQAAMTEQQVQHDWFFCRGYYLQATNAFRPFTPAELGYPDPQPATSIPASSASSASDPKTLTPLPLAAAPAADASTGPLPPAPPSIPPSPSPSIPAPLPLSLSLPMPMPMAPPAPVMPPAMRPLTAQQHVPLSVAPPPPSLPAQPSTSAPLPARPLDDKPGVTLPPSKRKATGRVCVECGATSTPQWREGPAGPKTLCNACGVRHVRSIQRASKGRGSAAKSGGAAGAAQQPGSAGPAPPARAGKGKAAAEATKSAAEPSTRPVRQAAIAASSRTAAFARTGEFPDEAPAAAGPSGARRGGAPVAKPMPDFTDNADSVDAGPSAQGGNAPHSLGLGLLPPGLNLFASEDTDPSSALLPSSDEPFVHPNGRAAAVAPCTQLPSSLPPHPLTGLLSSSVLHFDRPVSPAQQQQQQPAAQAPPSSPTSPFQPFAPSPGLADTPAAAPGPHTPAAAAVANVIPPFCGAAPREQLQPAGTALTSGLEPDAASPATATAEPQAETAQGLILRIDPAPSLRPQVRPSQVEDPAAPAAAGPPANQGELAALLLRVCKQLPELAAFATVFSEAERTCTPLPVGLLQRLAEVKEQVELASKEAEAADAAVHAVQQVYSSRMEAAERARSSAAVAGQKLFKYVAQLASAHSVAAAAAGPAAAAAAAAGEPTPGDSSALLTPSSLEPLDPATVSALAALMLPLRAATAAGPDASDGDPEPAQAAPAQAAGMDSSEA